MRHYYKKEDMEKIKKHMSTMLNMSTAQISQKLTKLGFERPNGEPIDIEEAYRLKYRLFRKSRTKRQLVSSKKEEDKDTTMISETRALSQLILNMPWADSKKTRILKEVWA